LFCPKTFDGWGCWNDTPVGETAYIHCPPFIPGFSPESKSFKLKFIIIDVVIWNYFDEDFAHKICTENGTWYKHYLTNKTWSNYTGCIDRVDLEVSVFTWKTSFLEQANFKYAINSFVK